MKGYVSTSREFIRWRTNVKQKIAPKRKHWYITLLTLSSSTATSTFLKATGKYPVGNICQSSVGYVNTCTCEMNKYNLPIIGKIMKKKKKKKAMNAWWNNRNIASAWRSYKKNRKGVQNCNECPKHDCGVQNNKKAPDITVVVQQRQ